MDIKPFHESDTEIELATKAIMNFGIVNSTDNKEIINKLARVVHLQLSELTKRDENLGRMISNFMLIYNYSPQILINDDGTVEFHYTRLEHYQPVVKQYKVNENYIPMLRVIFKTFRSVFIVKDA